MVGDREGVCLVQGLIVELNKWMIPQNLKQCLAHVWPALLFDRMHLPACPGAGLGEGDFLLGGLSSILHPVSHLGGATGPEEARGENISTVLWLF